MAEEVGNPRLTALRSHDFRLLWLGEFVSITGSQMQIFAINWHVSELLRGEMINVGNTDIVLSAPALGLGLLGLARVIPIILFALVGGVLADAVDRRKLMIGTRITAAVLASMLALATFTGNESIGTIYLVTAALAATTAFDNPARQSLVPSLVPREHLANAVSLNTLMWQIATIVGPAVTGLLVANFNIGLVYAINAVTFFVAIIALALLRYRGGRTSISGGIGWGALVEGLRFTFGTPIIRGTMLLDFLATFFSSAQTMLPIVARDILGVGAEGYGLLATAQPIGSVIAGSIVALRKDIKRQGAVLLASVAVYGGATTLFGLSTSFILSYVFFALTGAGDTVSTVIRGTVRQMMTPDHLRGRMVSVNMIFFMGGPQLGELEAGLVAALFSANPALGASFAIVTGGIATVLLTGVIAWKYPRLRQYTSQPEATVVPQ
jgi:MFS family permease